MKTKFFKTKKQGKSDSSVNDIYSNVPNSNDAKPDTTASSPSMTDSLTGSYTTSVPLFGRRKSSLNSSSINIVSDRPAMSL